MIRTIALALLLAGCAGPAITSRTVTWTMTDNPTAVCGMGFAVDGCAMWLPDSDPDRHFCHIVTRPPADNGDLYTLGVIHHELRHCQEGLWHE